MEDKIRIDYTNNKITQEKWDKIFGKKEEVISEEKEEKNDNQKS